MEMKLAENIRLFRKQRGLTQEQMAEVMGVTVGAVHKWEARLSTPDLNLIMEMADFFDVSVDVLLGYRMKDNRLTAVTERLSGYISIEDPEGLPEAEKALKRFPNSFDVVYLSAVIYMIFGGKNHDDGQLARAFELLQKSLYLLPQNASPAVSEISIYDFMANVLIMRGLGDQAAELLKQHNRSGIYNDLIGMTLSLFCTRPGEAQPFLSEAFLDLLAKMIQTVIGKAYAYALSGETNLAESLLEWCLNMLEGLKRPEMPGYIDQSCSFLHLLLAFVQLKKGDSALARKTMTQALEDAARFDSSPRYDARCVRFVEGAEQFNLHYILGSTARDSLSRLVELSADEALTVLWKEMTDHEKHG